MLEKTLRILLTDLNWVLEWLKINTLKAKCGRFWFMNFGNKEERSFDIHINNVKIKNSYDKKYIIQLCRRASYKLHTLQRTRKYLTVDTAKLLANALINSQFNYVRPLIWMFASKSSIDKILKMHKRTRQIFYDVYNESYENLLSTSHEISIHQKHLWNFATEVYQSLNKINPAFKWKFFERNHIPYYLRRSDLLLLPPAKSTCYGVNSFLSFRGELAME